MNLAAIDIGSNAARLLITEVTDTEKKPVFEKLNLVRIPLRLGFDVFETGRISEKKIDMFIKTMKAYKLLLDVYDVKFL
ncbi:MAG TPA: exopolyphosphatase, partial [Puia sp.]|nr:exopolyphosphatase [Puia sp.]